MTKMKSKKMNKSTFAVIIMAIVMVAMLAFGGTYAYFTANAIGESVGNISTAQLELFNKGDGGENPRLEYTATNEIVPGDYVFGSGVLNPETATIEQDITNWQKVDLDLGATNAAVYAFVKVTTQATSAQGTKTLMVATAYDETSGNPTSFEPVLKLIPRTGVDHVTTPKTAGWQQFGAEGAESVDDSSNNTYIFYFKVDDINDWRTEFNTIDFEFALQFDSRVMADRTQTEADPTKTLETTNVYEEATGTVAKDSYVSIMGVQVSFTMEFATIQQTGFNNAHDAYEALFNDGTYTDNNMTPGDNQ